MEQGTGSILREARTRRKIELSEVESITRIRQRYLRAIENEEWDVLPGAVYARGFVRTYASFLGLDGERLAADHRRTVEGGRRAGQPAQPAASGPPVRVPPQRRRSLPAVGWLVAAGVVALAAVVVVVSESGGGGNEPGVAPSTRPSSRPTHQTTAPAHVQTAGRSVSVRLAAEAEVWVCLLDGRGKALVDGLILEAGAEEGPFHSGSFTVSFGNGEVSMRIDGREAKIPATSSPIGYSIDPSGAMTELSESERPTCA